MPSGEASQNGFGGLHGGVAFDLVTDAAVGGATQQAGVPARANGALLRYLAPAIVGPFRAVPTVMVEEDGAAFVRVQVYDDGQDAKLCILGEVHTTTIR
jgi:acyl-coenzyme A thioesterase PaaI-like protein